MSNTVRYPSNISTNGTYMILTAYKSRGWKTSELQTINQVKMELDAYRAIGLPVPNNLTDSTSLNYSDIQDSNVGGMIANTAIEKSGFTKTIQEGKLKTGSSIAQQATQIFNSVTPKTFTFNWVLIPESAQDASNIQEIIQTFELAKLPSQSVGNTVLKSPDLFKISFGGVKPNLLRYLPSVITGIEVSYNTNSHFQLYKDGNFPQIDLAVTFVEYVARTRDLQQSLYNRG